MVVPQVHAVLDARHAMDAQIAEELPALMLLANAPDAQIHVEKVPVVMDAFHHASIAVAMLALVVVVVVTSNALKVLQLLLVTMEPNLILVLFQIQHHFAKVVALVEPAPQLAQLHAVAYAPVNVLENVKVRALEDVRVNVKADVELVVQTDVLVSVLVVQTGATDVLEHVTVAQIAVRVAHLVIMIVIPHVFLNVEVVAHLNVEMDVKMVVILDVKIAVSRLAQKHAMVLV